MTTYSISYDSLQLQNVEKQLDAFLQSNRNVTSWAKPFSGLYFVRSQIDQSALYENLSTFFPEAVPFFVTQVDATTSAGILPQYVWTWLNSPDYAGLLSQ